MTLAAPIHIRVAKSHETPAMQALIDASARALSLNDYSAEETEAAVAYVFGVDSELVADGTYFIAESDGQMLGCGGWSKRKTLFGGDQYAGRESGFLNPATDAAKIRAFFVHPHHARKGVAKALLAHCESQARAAGFSRMEMMSTLPGVPFYAACGYGGVRQENFTMPNGIVLRFLPMSKAL